MSNLVRYEATQRVAVLTIDNPPVNALGPGVLEAIEDAIVRGLGDSEVDALVLIGAGQTFVAGADINIFKTVKTREQSLERSEQMHARLKRFEDARKPLVAAIHGNALGGGLELAMACHYRVATADAKVGQPEVSLGIVPGAGATYRLPRVVGAGKARELVFTGRILDAAEALRIGLVNQVVQDAEVPAAARRLADEILKQDRLAVRFAKLLFRLDGSARPGAGFIGEAMAQAVLFESDEKSRRMTEFLERGRRK